MTLASTGRSKERILLFGMEGVGKSLAALDIAARCAPRTLHVIDNDNAWDRMLEGSTLAGDSVGVREEYTWDGRDWVLDSEWCVDDGSVVVFHAQGWEANIAAVAAVREEAKPQDWCLIDSGTALWSDVQDWYTDTVYGNTLAEYLLALKTGAKTEEKDDPKWQVINAQYTQGVGNFLVNPPCHLLITAEQKDVNVAKERDKEIKGMYGTFYVRPAGQKRLGHQVQTVIQLGKSQSGDEYTAKTVKDRGGRERWAGEEITGKGFGEWYLEEVAGWTEQSSLASSTTNGTATDPVQASTPVPSSASATSSGAPSPAPKDSSSGLVVKKKIIKKIKKEASDAGA